MCHRESIGFDRRNVVVSRVLTREWQRKEKLCVWGMSVDALEGAG